MSKISTSYKVNTLCVIINRIALARLKYCRCWQFIFSRSNKKLFPYPGEQQEQI